MLRKIAKGKVCILAALMSVFVTGGIAAPQVMAQGSLAIPMPPIVTASYPNQPYKAGDTIDYTVYFAIPASPMEKYIDPSSISQGSEHIRPSVSFDLVSDNAQIVSYTCDEAGVYAAFMSNYYDQFFVDPLTGQSTIRVLVRQDEQIDQLMSNISIAACPVSSDSTILSFDDIEFRATDKITGEPVSISGTTIFLKYTVKVHVNDDAPVDSVVLGEGKVLYDGMTYGEVEAWNRQTTVGDMWHDYQRSPYYALLTNNTDGHVVIFSGYDPDTNEVAPEPFSFFFPQGQAINPTVQNSIIAAVTPDQTPEPTPTDPEPITDTPTTPTTPEQSTQTPAETEPLADTGVSVNLLVAVALLVTMTGAMVFVRGRLA